MKVLVKISNEKFYSSIKFHSYQNFWEGCSPYGRTAQDPPRWYLILIYALDHYNYRVSFSGFCNVGYALDHSPNVWSFLI